MSSTSGCHTKQSTGNLQYNDSGWSAPNPSASLSSPTLHPDSWPQLGTGPDPVPKSDPGQPQSQEISDNMQQHPEPTGWDAPSPSTSSSTTGWDVPSSQSTGWGGAVNSGGNNWARQPQIDNGTALWGKQNQSGSGWGGPLSTQASAATSPWNTGQIPAIPSPGPNIPTSNTAQHQDEHNIPPQSSSSAQPSQPESWAAAAAVTPTQGPPGPSHSPASSVSQPSGKETGNSQEQPLAEQNQNDPSETSAPVDPSEQLQKLVDSHEGWGKRPIQQNSSWDVADSQMSYAGQPPSKTGTEAWGKAPPGKPASEWQPPPDSSGQQQWGKPASNPPVRGWGTVPSQPLMQPRPLWGGVQPSNPTPQTGWGDPRLPSPANPINRWNAPTNAMPNTANQGWGTSNAQPTGWNTSGASGDNSGWGSNAQRNSHPSNWGAPPPRHPSEGNWNQTPNMQRQPSMVDDGTSAWGDPTAYKNVNMWDRKTSAGSSMGAGDAGQNRSEPTGWGTASTTQGMNNKPSSTGWGDVNTSKPVDDSTSSWAKTSLGGSNWDQGWAVGNVPSNNGWGGNTEQSGLQWGQADVNDPSRTKSRDFGFVDRKTSTGSDNVFEDGQLDRSGTGMGADMGAGPGVNYGQFPIVSAGNNSAMPGLNGPRPMPPQSLMGLQAQGRQAPPPQIPAQFQNQIHQIRHAVMKGVIPPHVLSPQLMTPQHLNHLQQLIMKITEYQQLTARMNMLNKPNAPPHLRSQQEQIARMRQQLQQQIQALQHMITQRALQKPSPVHDKSPMGTMRSNPGLGLDLLPLSGSMPPGNSSISPFNMSGISQRLPSAGGNPMNREQQSRLHAWRRPSAGFDNSSEGMNLGPGVQPSISDMIGGSGLLNPSSKHGGLLGFQQTDSRMLGGEQSYGANDLSENFDVAKQSNEVASAVATPDHDPSNLKNILADIGPPEFIPGKKWAGFRPIDPESDPDITPGSVAYAKTMSVNTVKDADQVLNRERQSMSQQDVTALNTIDVTAKIQPTLASSFANVSNDNPTKTAPTPWSTASRWQDNKFWLVLSNISPNMNFAILQNLCNMSRPVSSFHPNYPVQGKALVKYRTSEDAVFTRNKLATSFAGTNMLTVSVVSDQEVSNFFGSANSWNPGSSGRQLFGSTNTSLGQHPQAPSGGFGGGPPMMRNPDMPYGGDAQSLWSTGDNGSGMPAPHATASWSSGVNHGPGRTMNMWNNGLYDNPRVSPHNLLPENLLGEHTL